MDTQRLIDANALEKRFRSYCDDCLNDKDIHTASIFSDAIAEIQDSPTIDPIRHEKWELCSDGVYKCTGCEWTANKCQHLQWDFCPKCGAKMRRDTDEQ